VTKEATKIKPPGNMAPLAALKKEPGVVLPLVKKVLMDRNNTTFDPTRRTDIIHPSELCRSDFCPRATYWRITGRQQKPENIPFNLENILTEGNSIHEKWQRWLRKSGKLWGLWQCDMCDMDVTGFDPILCLECGSKINYAEVPLEVPDYMMAGFEDAGLPDSATLVELKSVGLGTLRHEMPKLLKMHSVRADSHDVPDLQKIWANIRSPFPSHLKQACIYLWMAQQMELPFIRVSVVYEFKPSQRVKEFIVGLDIMADIMPRILEKALNVKHAIEDNKEPSCYVNSSCKQCERFEDAGV
jgi:hypothetical protein